MILVTGGTGLLGSHLLYQLVISGINPIALKRKSSDISKTRKIFNYYNDNVDDLMNKIKWVDGDILDYHSIEDAFDGVTEVYHTAATVSFKSSDKKKILSNNIQGTANIVNVSLNKKIKKLVHVSSIGALGRADTNGLVTEETHWNSKKTSVYSTSKYSSELEVWRGIAEGLNALIINPSIILGPGDWDSGSSKLFKTMYNGLKFYSNGTNGFVDVNDVVTIMIQLMNNSISGERFIVNSENISYKDLFYTMAKELKVEPPRYSASRFLAEIGWRVLWLKTLVTGKNATITRETAETANQEYRYSNNKIKNLTGIEFITVHESLKRNSAFFLKDLNN
jgi:nucleoside-diphosphate-sugar epimerase